MVESAFFTLGLVLMGLVWAGWNHLQAKTIRWVRHYKGGVYQILGEATHTETGERLVIYEPKSEIDHRWWARPKGMFYGAVEKDGGIVPRFHSMNPEAPFSF